MSGRHFSPDEVNALIPRLDELMESAMERHRGARALQQQLHEEKERIATSGGGRVDQRDWKARAERLDGLAIEVREILKQIQGLGGVIKDLDLGLVDFPGRVPDVMGQTTVNLCWRYGEATVGFWHGLDEGYAQRKPLP